MAAPRTCKVTVMGLDGTSHSVEVQAATLFEAASAAITAFRQEGWAADALTPNARLRVEVHPPPTVHEVTLKASNNGDGRRPRVHGTTFSSARSVVKRSGDRVRGPLTVRLPKASQPGIDLRCGVTQE